MSRAVLEANHPRVKRAPYGISSPVDPGYNCIAYAAGDNERWWGRFQGLNQAYWPAGAPRELTLEAFVAAYATIGYAPCSRPATTRSRSLPIRREGPHTPRSNYLAVGGPAKWDSRKTSTIRSTVCRVRPTGRSRNTSNER